MLFSPISGQWLENIDQEQGYSWQNFEAASPYCPKNSIFLHAHH